MIRSSRKWEKTCFPLHGTSNPSESSLARSTRGPFTNSMPAEAGYRRLPADDKAPGFAIETPTASLIGGRRPALQLAGAPTALSGELLLFEYGPQVPRDSGKQVLRPVGATKIK